MTPEKIKAIKDYYEWVSINPDCNCIECSDARQALIDSVPLLLSRIEELTAERDAMLEDMGLIVGDSHSALSCSFCKYNPNDMGCELDGTQFDDDGERHFTWVWRGVSGK